MGRFSWLAVTAIVFASSASAATVVVKQGTALATIQAGIDAAAPNDTVLVFAGAYHESALIPAGKPLTLKAKGTVIVDGRGPGGSALGPGLIMFDSVSRVTGFRFRHQLNVPGQLGVGIQLQPSGINSAVIIEKCTFEDCRNGGIYGYSNGIAIRQCVFRDIETGFAIELQRSMNAIIEKCQFSGTMGIYYDGTHSVLRSNTLKNCMSSVALVCNGDDNLVEKNSIVGCEGRGIGAQGDDVIVRKNKVENTGAAGIVVEDDGDATADHNLVENNSVAGSDVEGIRTAGDGTTVRKNTVRRIRIGGPALMMLLGPPESSGVRCTGKNAWVESNLVEDCAGNGISTLAEDAAVIKNRVNRCGTGWQYGVSVEGVGFDHSEVANNVITQQRGDGIGVFASSATIRFNRATSSTRDGFDVNGPDHFVESNVAIGNGAEGFDLAGPNMQFRKNVAKGNRIDIAAPFALALFESNSFGTGGPWTQPEID